MLSFFSICCHAEVIFIDAETLTAFDVALDDFKKKHLHNYCVFIERDDPYVIISFIEKGSDNSEGRPVAYGKGIEYKIHKKTKKIVTTRNTFDK